MAARVHGESTCSIYRASEANAGYQSPETYNSTEWGRGCATLGAEDVNLLMVIDESHVVRLWGLIKQQKKYYTQDGARTDERSFRGDYGYLATRLNQLRGVVLLMTATATPQACQETIESVRLRLDAVAFVDEELFTPHRRLIRVTMSESFASTGDLERLVKGRSADLDNFPPTLAYLRTQNATLVEIGRAHV